MSSDRCRLCGCELSKPTWASLYSEHNAYNISEYEWGAKLGCRFCAMVSTVFQDINKTNEVSKIIYRGPASIEEGWCLPFSAFFRQLVRREYGRNHIRLPAGNITVYPKGIVISF